jgi:adenine-specific DNA-methyltransferase
VSNLRKICDEVFGEDNFVEEIIWEKKFSPQNDSKYFSLNHEQILCYAKDKIKFNRNLLPMSEEQKARYKNPDNDPRGPWQSDNLTVATYNADYDYPITTPSGKVINPTSGRCWNTSEGRFKELVKGNRIWFGKDGSNTPRIKRFLSEIQQGRVPISIWYHREVGHTQSASQDLKKLFGDRKYFDFPKPVELLKKAIFIGSSKDDIILDFFAGSSTTAQAVIELNSKNNMNRKFIMVQLDENIDKNDKAFKDGYKNISQVGKERIRRAGDKIVEETKKTDLDIGFKVFKLDSSNLKSWDPTDEELEQLVLDLENNIKEGRSEEDLLYEILLKIGLPLTEQIEKISFKDKSIYNVAFGSVLLCLDNDINQETVKEMIQYKSEHMNTKVVIKETGFVNDSVKTNALQTLKKHGITDIRSV